MNRRTDREKLTHDVAILKAEEGKPRRFRMLAYTGAQFSRWWGQMMIDVEGMEDIPERGLPMLLDHDPSPVAVADHSEKTGEGYVLEGYFLDTEHAKHVLRLADQGFPWTASVGLKQVAAIEVKEGSELEVNGQKVKGPCEVWNKSKLYETSFITAGPADDATGVEVMHMADSAPIQGNEEILKELVELRKQREAEAKRKVYVESLAGAGVSKKAARGWFKDGVSLEDAFKKHAEVMAAERDEALAKVDHQQKTGELDERDARRVKAGITKGFDPKKLSGPPKRGPITMVREDGSEIGGRVRERVTASLKLAYKTWSQPDHEGLMLRSIFPRHMGGHELLHAVMQAEDNGEIRAAMAGDGKFPRVPLSTPYSIKKGTIELLAKCLQEGADAFSPGKTEELAGTWGRGAHAYSAMTVKGYLAALLKPLEDDVGKGWAQRVGITIPSNQETETYRFLGNPPHIRKLIGNRQTKFMPQFQLQIANDIYEGTVDFALNDFRFDKSGHIMIRMGELGIRARQHWDVLGTQVLLTNPTAYDGVTLLSTAASHTQGGGFLMKNSLVAADVPALSVSNPSNPTQQEMVAAIMGVIQYFFTFQDQTGSPINGDARQFVVMVPPNLWGAAVTAIRAARLNFGQDNPLLEQDYSVEVVPNGWLTTGLVGASTNTKTFYVFRVDSQFRPIIFQDVTGWEAQMLGPGSEHTFWKDRVVYGLKSTRGFGPGEWAHLIAGTFS